MNIAVNSVHVWYMEFNNSNVLTQEELFTLLNEEEKNKAKTFVKIKDKSNYISSHGYLRILLTKYYPQIKPDEWEFSINKYGKPSLSKKYTFNFFFNLSHTDAFMAFIFDTSNACGIDIEEDKGIIINNEMIDLVLSKGEKDLYTKVYKKDFFYRLWVIKESYVKALGVGLQQPFYKIDFSSVKDIEGNKNLTFIKNDDQFGVYTICNKVYLSYCVQKIKKEKHIRLYGCDDV